MISPGIYQSRSQESGGIDPFGLWYVPDRRLRLKSFADKALQIDRALSQGNATRTSGPAEEDLFVAMHTCAYLAGRNPRSRRIPMSERLDWARRWQRIREHIVQGNLGLVYSMIGRFSSKQLDEDDVLSDAMLSLTRAVDRFNPWRGYRFSTYACNVIARAIMRRGRRESNYRRLFPVQNDVSLEQPTDPPDDSAELYLERLRRALDSNLGELTALESEILSRRFLNGQERKLTFQEIGRTVGLSKERVRQIQNIALGKLRDVLTADAMLQ